MADAGFGLEPPARQFKLDFLPLARERYFLLCRTSLIGATTVAGVLQALQDPAFRAELDTLPGYDASIAGRVTPLAGAF
jgi:molybdate-binding protein